MISLDAVLFTLIAWSVILLPASLYWGVKVLKDWRRVRRIVKAVNLEFDSRSDHIERLGYDYRMMVAGRALVAESVDHKVRYLTSWIAQEKELVKGVELANLLPVQDDLIETLKYATKRGRGGVSPAEFRDEVENARRYGRI